MNNIILNNGIELKFNEAYGIDKIVIENKTITELENLLTKENLTKVNFTTSDINQINGTYENLECVSIAKYLEKNIIVIKLRQI